ncbi:MAG: type II secretion system F family protein [Deltaproteobacteria bacterium]|nr:type II secretion system F family protein [Deltaproteobacteria bacterium]
MSIVVFLLVTGSVFFFTLVIASVLHRAYESYQERYVTQDMQSFTEVLLFVDARSLFVLAVCLSAMMVTMGLVFFGWLMTLFMGVAGFVTPILMVRFYRKKRLQTFNTQLVDALQAMANAFKAGLTFPQAIEHVAREAPNPLGQEFQLFVKEIKLGVPLEDALVSMAGRMDSEDLELVVTSTNIARQLGGNMAEMFETISGTIRERFRLEGKIAALTSQGKMQGWIVASMPLALGVALNYMRPDLMEPMMNHLFGFVLVVAIMIMEAMGLWLIMKIVNVDV